MKTFNNKVLQYVQAYGETIGIETKITCPYCGYEDDSTWGCELLDEDVATVTCGHCGKDFLVECHVLRTFKSKPKVSYIGVNAVKKLYWHCPSCGSHEPVEQTGDGNEYDLGDCEPCIECYCPSYVVTLKGGAAIEQGRALGIPFDIKRILEATKEKS